MYKRTRRHIQCLAQSRSIKSDCLVPPALIHSQSGERTSDRGKWGGMDTVCAGFGAHTKSYGDLEKVEIGLVKQQKWKISWENAFLPNRKGCEDFGEV